MFLIDIIAGARPNFMKIGPIIDALRRDIDKGSSLRYRLIHTGQHYDYNMSDSFFEELGIPKPDINLGVGSGSHAEQTANIMIRYEQALFRKKSDLCMVVGDVNSTMACAITARKNGLAVAHVEGGLRSGDWTMPEEINRVVTDSISNWFYTTSEYANDNLIRSGVDEERIRFVGNTMVDSLLKNLIYTRKPSVWDELGLQEKKYLVITLHRPNNVDDAKKLGLMLMEIERNAQGHPTVFPIHPRTEKSLAKIAYASRNIHMIKPVGYLEFIFLMKNSLAVITDSGGITEEATVLGVPCMTLRDTTERPETIIIGTNELAGTDPRGIGSLLARLFSGKWKKGKIPPLWDGGAAERIVDHLARLAPKALHS